MPSRRNSVIAIDPTEYVLACEWLDCTAVFGDVHSLTLHLNEHLAAYIRERSQNGETDNNLPCQWRECNTDVEGGTTDFLRHVYFHLFHVKIKCIGALLLEKTGHLPCNLDKQSRNLIPELPECLECGWTECHMRYENAEIFYRHVEMHAERYPGGNHTKDGCRCYWEGCETVVKSRHKLKDHLRSHTQEKLVACPTCGALFSTRTKFFDHLDRQLASVAGKRYQCSHCSRTFAAERLLRDHMRNHVNQYKCPYCDMTSPFPANLRVHIKYRHTDEKPFKCELCDYSGKVLADLRKHSEVHNESQQYPCQVDGCSYTARAYQSLANHFKKSHQSDGQPRYQCHLCSSRLMRGSLLTKHLKKQHTFTWPSGHSRFRYKLHVDGLWRLQTVRYESVEVQDEDTTESAETVEDSELLPEGSEPKSECVEQVEETDAGTVVKQQSETDERNFLEAAVYIDNAAGFLDSLHELTGVPGLSEDEDDDNDDETGQGNESDNWSERHEIIVENSESYATSGLLSKKRKCSNDEEGNARQDKRSKFASDLSDNRTSTGEKTKYSKCYSSNKKHMFTQDEKENSSTVSGESAMKKSLDSWSENTLEELVAPDVGEETDEECVTIQIVKNKDGQYMIRTEDSVSDLPVNIDVAGDETGVEENMYNLQMLGEVALQNR